MLFDIIRASPRIVPATAPHSLINLLQLLLSTNTNTTHDIPSTTELFLAMYTTSQLNIIIADIIDDVISKWETEYSRITIESFRRKKDCLVIIKIRKFSHKNHFLKTAISIDSSNVLHLRTIFSHFESICRL